MLPAPSLSLLAALLAPPSALAAECATSTQALDRRLTEAEDAYTRADPDAFQQAVALLEKQIPCLEGEVSAVRAARVHRVLGLGRYVANDRAAAGLAFAAARAADPGWRFPDAMVAPGNPVRTLYERGTTGEPSRSERLPSLFQDLYLVDGRVSPSRPVDRPSLVQVASPLGRVHASTYLWPGDPLPPSFSPFLLVPPLQADTPRDADPTLWFLAGGAVLVSGGLFTASRFAWNDFYDDETSYADLPGLRTRYNVLTLSSAGVGAIAVGLGAGALWTTRW